MMRNKRQGYFFFPAFPLSGEDEAQIILYGSLIGDEISFYVDVKSSGFEAQ